MGKTIIADENLLNTLTELSERKGYTSGLIIGQPSQKKDFATHLLVTSAPESEKLEQIDESLLKWQLKSVMGSLPGGIYVLGVFLVGPDDVFNDKIKVQKVRSLITLVSSTLRSNVYIFGKNQDINLVGLHFSSISKRYLSKNFDVHNMSSSLTPVTWKFVKNPVSWLRVDCNYDMGKSFTLNISDNYSKVSYETMMKVLLSAFVIELKNNKCAINGFTDKFFGSETLEDLLKKKGTSPEDESTNILKAFMFGPLGSQDRSNNGPPIKKVSRIGAIKYGGVLSSRVFLQRSTSVQEAVEAIKEDLIRTLAVRLEFHHDSLENDSEIDILHVPPRRVMYEHPTSGIMFSDYMFPDDTIEDVAVSFMEKLGFQVSPSSLLTDLEPEGLEGSNIDFVNEKTTISSSKSSQGVCVVERRGIVTAIIVLIASLCIYFIHKIFSD